MTPKKQSLHHRGETISASTSTSRTSTPTTFASEEERYWSTEAGKELLSFVTNQSTITTLAAGAGGGGIDPSEEVNGATFDTNNNISSLTSNAASSSSPDTASSVIPPITDLSNDEDNTTTRTTTTTTTTTTKKHRREKRTKSVFATISLLTGSKYTTLEVAAMGAIAVSMVILLFAFALVFVALDENQGFKVAHMKDKDTISQLQETIDQQLRMSPRQEEETLVTSSWNSYSFFEEWILPHDDDSTVEDNIEVTGDGGSCRNAFSSDGDGDTCTRSRGSAGRKRNAFSDDSRKEFCQRRGYAYCVLSKFACIFGGLV